MLDLLNKNFSNLKVFKLSKKFKNKHFFQKTLSKKNLCSCRCLIINYYKILTFIILCSKKPVYNRRVFLEQIITYLYYFANAFSEAQALTATFSTAAQSCFPSKY